MFFPMLSLLPILLTFAGAVQTPKVLSVCDILAEPQKYDGHTVIIRAMLVSSPNNSEFDELAPLISDRCYAARRRDGLRIGTASNYMPAPPDGWKPDLDSYDRALLRINALLEKDPELKSVLVTVEGVVHDGGPEPSGPTRHPWYAATMAIAVWKDVQGA